MVKEKCYLCGRKHQTRKKISVKGAGGKPVEAWAIDSPCFTEISRQACGLVNRAIKETNLPE